MSRQIALLTHSSRPDAQEIGVELTRTFDSKGVKVVKLTEEETLSDEIEMLLVLGGDGTILRASQKSFNTQVPLLGVNLGHVGFLAEAERADLDFLVDAVLGQRYRVEERMVLGASFNDGHEDFAINEFAIEKSGSRMIEILLSIDSRPVSRWFCDGVIASTPTGSTAYAFSAGGPVIWPDVEAVQIVPLAAHALFARSLVVSPSSTIKLTLAAGAATVIADGLRQSPLNIGDTITLTKSSKNLRLARLHSTPFADRLVAKFKLPVDGWRES